jgi:O-antigen/teichoic acid export membrane protein
MIISLIRNGIWTVFGATASRLANLLTTIAVARIISPSEFGVFSLTQNTVATLTAFATFGLATTCSKRLAELQNDKKILKEDFTYFLKISIIALSSFCLLLLLFSQQLSIYLYQNENVRPALIASSLILFFSSATSILQGGLMGIHEFKTIAKLNALSAIALLIIPTIATYLWGAKIGIFSLAIPHALNFALSLKAACKFELITKIKTSFETRKRNKKVLIGFTLPAAFSASLIGPTNWLAMVLLVRVSGNLQQIAEYNVAYQLYAAILFIPSTLASITLPILASKKQKSVKSSFIASTMLTTAIAFIISVSIYLFSSEILSLYGRHYESSDKILQILCIVVVINSLNLNAANLIASSGKMWLGFLANICWAVIYISTSYLWAPTYYGYGLALALLAAYIFHTLFQGFLVFNLFKRLP